jgi:predicted dinucleotide-binding enzyme
MSLALRSWCECASVFKTLNRVGFETLADPGRQPRQPVMFVARDDVAGKPTVLRLVAGLGFEAIDRRPPSRTPA